MTTYPTRTDFSALGSFGERMSIRWGRYSSVVLRYALGVGFLSAVADRFGLWGPYGTPNVDWGDFSRFLEYTQTINWFVPAKMIPLLGAVATIAETVFGVLLIFGWQTHATALLSELLLLCFVLFFVIFCFFFFFFFVIKNPPNCFFDFLSFVGIRRGNGAWVRSQG